MVLKGYLQNCITTSQSIGPTLRCLRWIQHGLIQHDLKLPTMEKKRLIWADPVRFRPGLNHDSPLALLGHTRPMVFIGRSARQVVTRQVSHQNPTGQLSRVQEGAAMPLIQMSHFRSTTVEQTWLHPGVGLAPRKPLKTARHFGTAAPVAMVPSPPLEKMTSLIDGARCSLHVQHA